ncbi:MAG: energy-coupling factor transporter transmembrane protein EcfT [Clostridia bacterium]|nr:energy-coupling factor transporter transmembrane protein EcfT [Clostridia bacterium]MBO4886155.1 energy-coupling factor transporter transmembrane protein EcfT [Clostridia bacterium]
MQITIGQYFPGTSPLHRMDPRAKILFTIALIAGVFLADSAAGYAVMFAFVFAAIRVSRIGVKFIVKGLKPILFIMLFTFFINMFFTSGGTVLLEWRFIRVTDSGVRAASFMALRLALLVIVSQLLTLTTSSIELTDGIEALLRPLSKIGFPAHELAMMMSIAMRFIPTLMEETDKIMKAQMARGADFESGNLIQRARAMLPLLVPLFVSAFRRADELALAMEARCYRGGQGRTRMKQLRFTRLDAIGAACVAALIAAVCVL